MASTGRSALHFGLQLMLLVGVLLSASAARAGIPAPGDIIVTGIRRSTQAAVAPVGTTSLVFQLGASKAIAGVDINDFVLVKTGTNAGGTISSVSSTNGWIYNITVTNVTGAAGSTFKVALSSTAAMTDTNNVPVDLSFPPYLESYTLVPASQPLGWGNNQFGNIGDGTQTSRLIPAFTSTSGGSALAGKTLVVARGGNAFTLGLCSDGTLVTWGVNQQGQLGLGAESGDLPLVPVSVTGVSGQTFVAIAAGQAHALAATSDGRVYAWGDNRYGQIGDGTTTNRPTPLVVNLSGVLAAGEKIVSVGAAAYTSFALSSAGKIYSWGYNGNGQLGINTGDDYVPTPVAVITELGGGLGGRFVVAISGGDSGLTALTTEGTVFGVSNKPSMFYTGSGSALEGKIVGAIAAGRDHGLALTSDGLLCAWGYNGDGQTGTGGNSSPRYPAFVSTATGSALAGKTVVAIGATVASSYALTSDGLVTAWGNNSGGQLGDGTTTLRRLPVAVTATRDSALYGASVFDFITGGSMDNFVGALGVAQAAHSESFTSPTGTFKAGSSIAFTVTFDRAVTVTTTNGTPRIPLYFTGATTYAAYSGTSNAGKTLTFAYVVQAGDQVSVTPIMASAIQLNGGTIRDTNSVDAVLIISSPEYATFDIDTVAPTVSSIVRTASAPEVTRASSGTVKFTVTFSEGVSGVTASAFTLTKTGTVTGTISTVAEATSGPDKRKGKGPVTTYDVTVDNVTGNGTLRLDVGASSGLADAAGNVVTAYSSGESYTVLTTPPAPPVFTSISDDTGVSATDGVTKDTTLVINGTTAVGSSVMVSLGTTTLGAATVDASGNWTFDYTGTVLTEGTSTFTAIAIDAVGNTSRTSANFFVTIDTTAPVFTSAATARANPGEAFSFTLTASDAGSETGYRAFDATGLPTGLSIDTATGAITGTTNEVGPFTVSLTVTDRAGNVGTGSLALLVGKLTPVITWTEPTAITYGTALSATQLNATASVAGTFTYSPALGAVLGAGAQTLGATFTPTDTVRYATVTGITVPLTVNRAAVTISGLAVTTRAYDGTTPAAITGTPTLNSVRPADVANVSVAGTAAGLFADKNVGTRSVTVSGLSLSGSASGNYLLTVPTLSGTISAKALTVAGITVASRAYNGGTAATLNLGGAALIGVVSAEGVTLVTSGATGTFADANVGPAKTVTISGLALGGSGTSNYTLTQPIASGVITTASASITISNLSYTYDGNPKAATITVSPSVATAVVYSGGSAPTNAGSYLVSVNVTDNNYSGNASATLTIAKAAQTVNFSLTGSDFKVGSSLGLSAAATSGGPVTYGVVSGTASLSSTSVAITQVGAVTLRASQAGNDNYLPASAEASFTGVAAPKQNQSISFAALSDVSIDTGSVALSATASSGLPVSYEVISGPARVSGGNRLTLAGSAGVVTVRASQAGNATYNAATEVLQSFLVFRAVAPVTLRIYFGDLSDDPSAGPDSRGELIQSSGPRLEAKAGDVAAAVFTDTNRATLLIVSAVKGLNVSLDFALNADGTYFVPFTSAGRNLVVAGALSGTTLTGRIAALGVNFSTTVQARTGATQDLAGVYQSNAVNSATGGTSTIVSASGQILVVSNSGTVSTGAAGTVGANGAFTLATANGTIAGAVDAATTSVTGTISTSGQTTVDFSGNSASAPRADRLINISSRVTIAPTRTVITGFVLGGTEAKKVLIRGVGPALGGFGVKGALANPKLSLFDATGKLIAENDDWSGAEASAAFTQVGAFALTAGSKDAALLTSLQPGAYTVQITGGTDTGTALVEIYDASTTTDADAQRIVNISTRGAVDTTADGLLIGGFVITGNVPKKVLIRGVGPGLGAFGVAGTLVDPQLSVFSGSTLIARNDDWSVPTPVGPTQTAASAADLATAAQSVGAFALAANSKDSALIITLAPGAYTAQIAGANGTSGTAIVEVYELK